MAPLRGPVLITGATGFVGSRLARRLGADGAQVHAIVRPSSSLSLLDGASGDIRTHVHDGTIEDLVRIVGVVKPSIAFHLGAHFIATHRTSDVEELVQSNILFGAQLLEALTVGGVHRLVNTGTSWQHRENEEYLPVSLYAATKQAFEDILRFYVDASPLRAISLHLFDTYGPGDTRAKLLKLLTEAAVSGAPLAMSPGEQQLDLVHVEDVVDAFLTAARRLLDDAVPAHDVYAVSSGARLDIRELAGMVAAVAGRPLSIEWGGRPYREREVMRPWSSGTPLPGWRPRIALGDGIRQVLGALSPSEASREDSRPPRAR